MSNQQTGGLKEHPVTLRAAVMMMYCLVAAGAFGIEEMIPDAGPGITIIVLCVYMGSAAGSLFGGAWFGHYRCRRILQMDPERSGRILGIPGLLVQNLILLCG